MQQLAVDKAGRRRLRAAVAAALGLAALPPGASVDAAAAGGRERVGVLIADHGEPPEYNRFTYWSFREFFEHLMTMGLYPAWQAAVDAGTVLQDRGCFGCSPPRTDPDLIDAWLRPHDGPAAFVPGSDRVTAHYLAPGGPGLGEPDIFEHLGLMTWREWELMGGRSPNYHQKLSRKRAVISRLRASYGDNVPVRVGYAIDPRIGGGRQGLREAVTGLVEAERADRIVVGYHGAGFSDLMQTHMIHHHIRELVERLEPTVEVIFTPPLGSTEAYVQAVVDHVGAEVGRLPAAAPVAVHLSEHGLPTTTCGDYDCGADAYHRFARRMFRRTRAAVVAAVRRPGRFGVFQVYGEGGEGDADPEDKVDSPIEALDKRARQGFRHVIDVPYAFDADSRDTLIPLRRGYRRPIPDWDARRESRFAYRGMQVKITNAAYGSARKTAALEQVVRAGIRDVARHPGDRGEHDDHHRSPPDVGQASTTIQSSLRSPGR